MAYVGLELPYIMPPPRRSLWRRWNQLSRLQRSLLLMSLAALTIIILLIYSKVTASSSLEAKAVVQSTLSVDRQRKDHQSQVVEPPQEDHPVVNPPREDNHVLKPPEEDNHVIKPPETDLEEGIFPAKPLKEDRPKSSHKAKAWKDNLFVNDSPKKAAFDKSVAEEEPPRRKESVEHHVEEEDSSSLVFKGPTNERQRAIVSAFKHAWEGYRKLAWGHDHLKPISRTPHDWFGMALTMIDALDTMYIMGLQKEWEEAVKYVKEELDFNVNKDANLFETTIRCLGGLLSAYHLSKDEGLRDKAVDLADRLLVSFNTPSGIPYSDVNLYTRVARAPKWSPDSSTSEVSTVQLEFRDLSRITGDPKYENAVKRVSDILHQLPKKDGLVPIFINANSGKFRQFSTITVGARGDSYYEYLLKQWLQTGKTNDDLKNDYNESISGMYNHLVKHTKPNGYLFIGEMSGGAKNFKNKMDHLTCYLAGTLVLGVRHGMPIWHKKFGEDLAHTCYRTYKMNPTGLAAEITYFNYLSDSTSDYFVKSSDAHNLLRPETLESLWYLYHFTGNTTYQEWGWQIFQAFEKYTKVPHGYTTIGDVRNALDTRPRDMMESFFLAETLKYLYLLFSDDQSQMSLDHWVFNSEAHPLPMYTR